MVEEVVASVSGGVIEEAVARLPQAHCDLIGMELEESLRRRRGDLAAAAEDLYRVVFREADVHGTDEDEVAVVSRTGAGDLRLSIRTRVSGPGAADRAHFQRDRYGFLSEPFLPGLR